MNKKGFIIIWDWRYFVFVGILVLILLGYFYFDEQGYIEEDSTAYEVGKFFNLQPPDSTIIEQKIFILANEHRASMGLNVLMWDNDLALIAREHSEDMYSRNFFDHTNPDGEGPTERAQKYNIPIVNGGWIGIAENIGETPIGDVIGCGIVSNEEEVARCAVDGWMDSPGHRENILNFNYLVIGVGVYCTESNCWTTQNFR